MSNKPVIIDTADALFRVVKLKSRVIPVDEKGEMAVEVFELTAGKRAELREFFNGSPSPQDALAMTVVLGCPLFSTADIHRLVMLPTTKLEELATAVLEMSGLSTTEDDAKKG